MPNLVQEYMTEPVTWGGLPTTRLEMIRELERQGYDQKRIDWIMFCHSQHEGKQEAVGA